VFEKKRRKGNGKKRGEVASIPSLRFIDSLKSEKKRRKENRKREGRKAPPISTLPGTRIREEEKTEKKPDAGSF